MINSINALFRLQSDPVGAAYSVLGYLARIFAPPPASTDFFYLFYEYNCDIIFIRHTNTGQRSLLKQKVITTTIDHDAYSRRVKI